jgi:hypothetical protein
MFLPPYCPNKLCINHFKKTQEKDWFIRFGYHKLKSGKKVQRYFCKSCGKSFSEQTFQIDRYVHVQVPYKYIMRRLQSGMGIRAISRELNVTSRVILNRCCRLSREFISINSKVNREFKLPVEMITDLYKSFVLSDYFQQKTRALAAAESIQLYLPKQLVSSLTFPQPAESSEQERSGITGNEAVKT